MLIFAISDQHDERWNRFHRQAQGAFDSVARFRTTYGDFQRLADEITEAEAEDLVRRYRERHGRK